MEWATQLAPSRAWTRLTNDINGRRRRRGNNWYGFESHPRLPQPLPDLWKPRRKGSSSSSGPSSSRRSILPSVMARTKSSSVSWGVLPLDDESQSARADVLSYLGSCGISNLAELEAVHGLPTSLDVVKERLEFLGQLGLDMDTLNAYPLLIGCSVRKNMIPVLDYLESLGVQRPQLPPLIQAYPMILHSSVIVDLAPVIEYLLGMGIRPADLPSVLLRFPDVFALKLEGTMSTSVAYLISLGVKTRQIAPILTAHPEIMGMRVSKTTKPLVDYLLRLGLSKESLPRTIEKFPRMLLYSLDRSVIPAVESLLEAGVKKEDLPDIITQYPEMLAQDIAARLERKREWLLQDLGVAPESLPRIITDLPQVLFIKEPIAMERVSFLKNQGFTADDIAKMVAECPQILALSIEKALKPSLEFLRNDMKRDAKELVQFPAYFTYDLVGTVQRRYKQITMKGVDFSLRWLLSCSNEKFKERLGYFNDGDSDGEIGSNRDDKLQSIDSEEEEEPARRALSSQIKDTNNSSSTPFSWSDEFDSSEDEEEEDDDDGDDDDDNDDDDDDEDEVEEEAKERK